MTTPKPSLEFYPDERYLAFIQKVRFPFIIVSALPPLCRQSVIHFLQYLQAPVYLEGISGIREEPTLQHLRFTRIERLWIEQLKSSAADRETVRKAIVELQALVIKAGEEMPLRKKGRQP